MLKNLTYIFFMISLVGFAQTLEMILDENFDVGIFPKEFIIDYVKISKL